MDERRHVRRGASGDTVHCAASTCDARGLRCRLDRARELDHAAGRSRWWDPGRCR